ncbi:hypothetical protein UA08_03214 [Talaromyces atroroseus]|uniref:UspA domain-containing protein n=1 Tax=Talaromyces atroroseus TaxID=1441469 RepID=A0A225AKA4_TALAT|nr:hypothetical protein UA08_03214 [Talaromyces atroroseus]OKL61300.1 hypothetical protein UA08_03214 [Talaromyces atroroseus]
MSLEQTLEDERQELLRNLDGLKSSKADGRGRKSTGNKREKTNRRASVSSPLASSSPWTNTLFSEWDDGLYEASDAEPERRASDSVAVTQRRKKDEVDIDAGFLYGMQPSFRHTPPPRYSARPPQSVPDVVQPSPSLPASKHLPPTTKTRMEKSAERTSDRNGRLPKDRVESADENSDYVESSDEADDTSSEEDVHDIRKGPVAPRGRSKVKAEPSPGVSPARSPAPPGGWSGKRGPGPLPPGSPRVGGALSLFNELQEEQELNGPLVTHRGANGRRTVLSPGPRKSGVHPNTSYDHNGSSVNTPVGSDDENDLYDIKQAQNLSIHMSSVDASIPDRAIRTIIRGDFPRLQQEAEEGLRRQRKYLVATDLSEESVYALEWTIGTILRDGDTLFAMYAVADENASGVDLSSGVQIGDGATVIRHTADVVGKQTEKTAMKYQASSSLLPNALAAYFGTDSKVNSRNNSVDARALSRAEQERSRAIHDISNTCVRLLRKTMLQVRVAVEVIHCKSPKHLLTEAIDGLEPTLVILGSRGRSAIKGVLLGSFSNYLVTKSSVPVMVARKKLKKHAKKTRIRLSNNLTTPRGLAGAKID